MKLTFVVTKVIKERHVDCSISDCFPDGYIKPGFVKLRTVSNTPVSRLPNATLEQFGHHDATGLLRIYARTRLSKTIFKRKPKVGDTFEIDVGISGRNRGLRKLGQFKCYPTQIKSS